VASATFSRCRRYRYVLERVVASGGITQARTVCVFIGLNPSTADERNDDPTIRRCKSFARGWGFDVCRVVNLYAWRATNPRALLGIEDPVGPRNDEWIVGATKDAGLIVCAWGNRGREVQADRPDKVVSLLKRARRELAALRITGAGAPEHPLYLPKTTTPAALR
jgi:hypothetical protein